MIKLTVKITGRWPRTNALWLDPKDIVYLYRYLNDAEATEMKTSTGRWMVQETPEEIVKIMHEEQQNFGTFLAEFSRRLKFIKCRWCGVEVFPENEQDCPKRLHEEGEHES